MRMFQKRSSSKKCSKVGSQKGMAQKVISKKVCWEREGSPFKYTYGRQEGGPIPLRTHVGFAPCEPDRMVRSHFRFSRFGRLTLRFGLRTSIFDRTVGIRSSHGANRTVGSQRISFRPFGNFHNLFSIKITDQIYFYK